MKKIPVFLGLLISAILISGCSIRTPEIHGVVLDAETKQPVEGAWVTATLGIKTKTVGGDSHTYLSVDPPHTRTDKEGKFIIPAKSFKKPLPPAGFGTDIENFGAGANTADDRWGSIDLKQFLGKGKTEVTIYVKPEEMTEGDYFSHLQAVYNYCLTGRFAVEVPAVEGGCDEWEVDYAIKKHERYLERWKDPQIIENPAYGVSKWDKIHKYSAVFKELTYLYKIKKDYKKALSIFKELKDFDERHKSNSSIKEYENQINELEQLLKKQGVNNE